MTLDESIELWMKEHEHEIIHACNIDTVVHEIVDRVSPWHIGTPSEEGWYLLHTKETIPYRVAYMRDNRLSTSDSYIRTDIVIEWQKIKEK